MLTIGLVSLSKPVNQFGFMRALLVLALLSTLTLAGCANDPDDPEPTSSTSSSSASFTATSTTATSSSTTTTTAAPSPKNEAPVATLAANVTSGLAPLQVRFTLGGSDAEGGALTYSFVLGDGSAPKTGTLPAAVNHTFTTVGNYTARLTVSDGKLSNDASVTIAALAGPGIPPPVTFNGTASDICAVPNPVTFEKVCLGDGPIEHNFTVPVAVQKIAVLLTWAFPASAVADLDFAVLDQDGVEVGSSGCSNFDPVPAQEIPEWGCNNGYLEQTEVTGIALDATATWKVVVSPFVAPMVPYTLTITYS